MLPAKMLSWPHFSWATLYIGQLYADVKGLLAR